MEEFKNELGFYKSLFQTVEKPSFDALRIFDTIQAHADKDLEGLKQIILNLGTNFTANRPSWIAQVGLQSSWSSTHFVQRIQD